MTTRTIGIIAVLLIGLAVPVSAQRSLLQKLLRIAGITAAPSQLRAPGDVGEGQVWMTDLRTRAARAVTGDSGYRSPAFAPDDTLYALEGDTLVRLDEAAATPLGEVPGAVKLVGFDPETPGELVVLLDGRDGRSLLATITVETGAITPIPIDVTMAEERQMVTFIRGDERVYDDVRLFTRTETRQGAIRAVEWTDVFLQRGTETPVNVSNGAGVSSGQPALSPDGTRVAYIKLPR